jgi:RHS repeat-associated protein
LDLTKPYNNLLERQVNDESESYLWDSKLLARDNTEYFLLDELGSPLRELDDMGLTVSNYGFDEFGLPIFDNATMQSVGNANVEIGIEKIPTAQNIQTPRPQIFGFTGYQQDEISGLNYAQARYYSGEQGRFVSKDIDKFIQVIDSGTLNQYGYCQSNPINYFDPMGFDLESQYSLKPDKNSPVQVSVSGNNVTVDFYGEFSGDIDIELNGATYKEIAIQGVNNWSGNYSNVFDENVNVNVNIHEGKNASEWKFWDNQKYYPINLYSSEGRSYVSTNPPSSSSNSMNLYQSGRNGDTMTKVTQHEFGHVLGIDDGYGDGSRPDAYEGGLIPYSDVMKSVTWEDGNMTISPKVIEMMILAEYYGEFQYFFDYDGNKKSIAWGGSPE